MEERKPIKSEVICIKRTFDISLPHRYLLAYRSYRVQGLHSIRNIHSQTPFSKFLEFAILAIPQRKMSIREMLRRAFGFLPMPLSLGWQPNPLDPDYPPEGLVKGLVISDIQPDATRAGWAP